jgi:hypothetical protein
MTAGATRVEAGSNTSTVTLRVVGGDENGSLKSETVKYGHESQETRTRGRLSWRGPKEYITDRRVLSSERASKENKTVTVMVMLTNDARSGLSWQKQRSTGTRLPSPAN